MQLDVPVRVLRDDADRAVAVDERILDEVPQRLFDALGVHRQRELRRRHDLDRALRGEAGGDPLAELLRTDRRGTEW